jgi:hypothetical protein
MERPPVRGRSAPQFTERLRLPFRGPRLVLVCWLLSLLQLLSLLLMLLLQLLRPRLVSFLLREPLVFLILLLLKPLSFLVLLHAQLFLLLLVFLVLLRVPRIWRGGPLRRWKVPGVHRICWPRTVVFRTASRLVASFHLATIGWRMVWRSCLPCRHHGASAKFPWFFGGGNRRPALVHRGP